jgi:hypothetical protein
MKHINSLLTYSFLTLLIITTPRLLAQDSNVSQSNENREVMVFNKLGFIEYFKPLDWEHDRSKDQINKYATLYPTNDSLMQNATIKIKANRDLPADIEFDSFVTNEVDKYKEEKNKVKISKQKDLLHKSIPFGKTFLIESNDHNMIEMVTYIVFDNVLVKFIFEPENQSAYEDYLQTYNEFISSIRFSNLN